MVQFFGNSMGFLPGHVEYYSSESHFGSCYFIHESFVVDCLVQGASESGTCPRNYWGNAGWDPSQFIAGQAVISVSVISDRVTVTVGHGALVPKHDQPS